MVLEGFWTGVRMGTKEGMTMTKMMLRRRQREHGATGIEYGLIAALVAAVLISIVSITGVNLSTVYCSVAGQVGVATGVDGACNDIGGGTDNPTNPDCDVNGNYTGDYSGPDFSWKKMEQYEHGYYLDGAWEGAYNDGGGYVYPDTERGDLVEAGWAVWHDTSGAHMDPVPNDGLPIWYQSEDLCSNGGGGGDNGDGHCVVINEGRWGWVGPTDNWYWVKTEGFENGTRTTDRSGVHWDGNAMSTFAWADRGALLEDPAGWNDRWFPNGGNNTWMNFIHYERGLLMVGVYAGTDMADLPEHPTDVDMAAQVDDGGYNSWWSGKDDPSQTETDMGYLYYTSWAASPDDNGGVRYPTAPDTGDDEVLWQPCE